MINIYHSFFFLLIKVYLNVRKIYCSPGGFLENLLVFLFSFRVISFNFYSSCAVDLEVVCLFVFTMYRIVDRLCMLPLSLCKLILAEDGSQKF